MFATNLPGWLIVCFRVALFICCLGALPGLLKASRRRGDFAADRFLLPVSDFLSTLNERRIGEWVISIAGCDKTYDVSARHLKCLAYFLYGQRFDTSLI